jgi:energy-coupling factor transporter ATP-binding protein EcfA2
MGPSGSGKSTPLDCLAGILVPGQGEAIAGCALAASIVAGLADRKRPFSTLRLTGAQETGGRSATAAASALAGTIVPPLGSHQRPSGQG